jgi:hypothetical protein
VSNPSTRLGRAVVAALVEGGVTDLVLAPGSRNAPLAFAAYDAAAAGLLRLHTRLDERSAGFLALGLSKVGARAAVVCTSGTAVANLHPAMLEAAHAEVPMVAVTADRPERLRGTSANQTTEQVGIFGPAVTSVDLAVGADGALRDIGLPDIGLPEIGLPERYRTHRVGSTLGAPYPSTSASTSRWCPRIAGRRTRRLDANCMFRAPNRAVWPKSASPGAPARSSWRGTTRDRRRGCWRRTPGGRCSRSRAPAAGRATTRCGAIDCSSTPSSAGRSSGSWWSVTPRCRGR